MNLPSVHPSMPTIWISASTTGHALNLAEPCACRGGHQTTLRSLTHAKSYAPLGLHMRQELRTSQGLCAARRMHDQERVSWVALAQSSARPRVGFHASTRNPPIMHIATLCYNFGNHYSPCLVTWYSKYLKNKRAVTLHRALSKRRIEEDLR